MFYSQEGFCIADTEGGPIVFTYVLFWVGNVHWTFNLEAVFCLFEILRYALRYALRYVLRYALRYVLRYALIGPIKLARFARSLWKC